MLLVLEEMVSPFTIESDVSCAFIIYGLIWYMLRYVPSMPLYLLNWEGLFFCLFACFLRLHQQHMEVPRLGVKSESCSCWPMLQPQSHQGRIQAIPMQDPYHSHANTRSLTHWARPGIKPQSPWIPVRFSMHWATTGTPVILLFYSIIISKNVLNHNPHKNVKWICLENFL